MGLCRLGPLITICIGILMQTSGNLLLYLAVKVGSEHIERRVKIDSYSLGLAVETRE